MELKQGGQMSKNQPRINGILLQWWSSNASRKEMVE